MNWIKRKWNLVKADAKTLKQFGLILSVILFVLGAVAFLRGHRHYQIEWPLGAASLIISLAAPRLMVFVYRPWMMVAEIISWVVLRIILGIFFYLILTPVRLIMTLLKKDILDQTIDRKAETYWKPRTDIRTKERYERLF